MLTQGEGIYATVDIYRLCHYTKFCGNHSVAWHCHSKNCWYVLK